MLIGHSHGLDVYSPSFGLSPAFPVNMTAWDSRKRERKPGENEEKLTFSTERERKQWILNNTSSLSCLGNPGAFVQLICIFDFLQTFFLGVEKHQRLDKSILKFLKFWNYCSPLTFLEHVVLHVPNGVGIPRGWVACDLLLLVPPLGELLAGNGQNALGEQGI